MSRFWIEGVNQLTRKGRNRMFEIGQFLNEAYSDFLARRTVPIEQFMTVRSSGSRRCLESASLLATGLLGPPRQEQLGRWENMSEYERLSTYWQPIPVKSIYPKGTDPLLDTIAPCPNAEAEFTEMQFKNEKLRSIYNENRDFLEEVSMYAGERINSLKSAYDLYQELFIERQYDYYWWKEPFNVWSEDYEAYAVSKLRELSRLYWSVQYDNRVLQTLRIGLLLKELNANIANYISGRATRQKVFIYSTQDTKIALLLHAFAIYNGYLVPPGASLLLELHQRQQSDSAQQTADLDSYFIRLYYYNETYSSDYAYQMASERICIGGKQGSQKEKQSSGSWHCPARHYLAQTSTLTPFDWQYQCGLKKLTLSYFAVNMWILATNFIFLLSLFIVLRIYSSSIRQRCSRRA